MKKFVGLFFCFVLLLPSASFAENYSGFYLTVITDLDPNYAKLIVENADSFCIIVKQHYLFAPDSRMLHIYYSKTQADTQKLLAKHGHTIKAEYGSYIPETPAVYAYQFTNNGEFCGWDTLFCEISHHIIYSNFPNCPEWFDDGLAGFLGEQRFVVKADLSPPKPCPWRAQILRDKIEKGTRPSIKLLFATSETGRFSNWDIGPHFARAFFYWLHESGNLTKYLANVRQNGYGLSVLEKTMGKPGEKINIELLHYIKKNCYAGAYLKDGLDAKDTAEKEAAFQKALELKPNYSAALHELARLYYKEKNYEKCRQYLVQILNNPSSADYRDAQEMMADTYYNNEKDYNTALTYYTTAWEYSDYYEYRHRTAYKIANCYYKLNDPDSAREWYATFLNCNWEPENTKTLVAYARNYIAAKIIHTQISRPLAAQKTSISNSDNKEKSMPKNAIKIKLQTGLGDIVVELDANAALVTAKNFLQYVEEGFYDGTIFHRVIPDFMIQGGGFKPDMEQKKTHAPIVNESANGLKNDRGTIAMARTNDPNSATAQFFINLKNNSPLNYSGSGKPGYAVFGKVVEGMSVVDAIAAVKTDQKGDYANVPVIPIVIKSAKVVHDK